MIEKETNDQPYQLPGIIERSGWFTQILMLIALAFVGGIIFTTLSVGCALWIFHVPSYTALSNLLTNQQDALLLNKNYLNAVKFMQLLSQIGTLGLPALVFAWLIARNKDYLHLKPKISLTLLLTGILLTLFISPLIGWLGDLNQRLWLPHFLKPLEDWMQSSEAANDKLTHVFTQMNTINELFINLIVIGIAAGICEELFFRGCLQNIVLRATRNPHIAIWLSAAVFSAVHVQFYGFVPRTVLGALLGYMYYYSGRLWINAWMHAFYNGIQVLLLYLFQSKIISYNIDENPTAPSFWLASISALLTIAIMLWVRQNSIKSRSLIQPNNQ